MTLTSTFAEKKLSKSERTRLRLRKCAASEFARLGYHGTKVSDIVAKANVTQPTFYAYFSTKEAAYEELISEFRERLETVTRMVPIPADTLAEGGVDEVTRGLLMFVDFLAEDRDLSEIGFFQAPARAETHERLIRSISSNVTAEQRSLLFRSDIRATQIARFFVGMIEQMAKQHANAKLRAKMAHEGALMICEGLWVKTNSSGS